MKKDKKEIWIGAQLITDKLNRYDYSSRIKILREKVSEVKRIVDLNGLIIFGHNNEEVCNTLIDICSRLEIETYLYYPVLADIPDYIVQQSAKVVNFKGQQGYGDISSWKRWLDILTTEQAEKFEFLCPNNVEAVNEFYNIYKNRIDKCGLDGVFFDRIRFPSASMGFDMLFSCFCSDCQKKFYKEFGENLLDYKIIIQSYLDTLRTATPIFFKNATSLEDFVFPKEMKNFVKFRDQSIYGIVKRFSEYARERGKKVGLDVYSYSLSGNVSQNYELLSKTCNWIKPMIYCHAKAPSGFTLELYCLLHSIKNLNPKMEEKDLLSIFGRVLKINLPERGLDLFDTGISEDVISREMEKINSLNLAQGVEVYPGIEVMKMGELCMITEKILEVYLKNVVESNAKGMIMSWNLLEMPNENLNLIGKYLDR